MTHPHSTGDLGQGFPRPLAEIAARFQGTAEQQRLSLLLEYAESLPPLPQRHRQNYGEMDEVVECQSPLFLATEFDDDAGVAEFHFAAPEDVPTTRGFASILQHGLNRQSFDEILSTREDVGAALGLGRLIAPLRLRAVGAICARMKAAVREHQNSVSE